jgi:hypothetical protein
LDAAGRVVRAEASWHGDYRDMRHNGTLTLEGDHLVIHSEPGKHAFAPTPHWFRERRQRFKRCETAHAPGNTLLGFHRAAELGADAVEFDVRLSADGQAVLAHEPWLVNAAGHVLVVSGPR